MTDDLTTRSGADRARIDVDQDHELRDWAEKFDATPEQIREAVASVGDRAEKVEMYLKGSHASTNSDQVQRVGKG
jgi:hypothetical protein